MPMPDMPTVTALLASVKHSIDVVKAINSSAHTLEQAEIRLKIAELLSSLADAKIQTAEIKDLLQEKDERIAELEDALAIKAQLVRQHDAYYEIDADGAHSGDPFCSRCWEVEYKQVHLIRVESGKPPDWKCPACGTIYNRRNISAPAPAASASKGRGPETQRPAWERINTRAGLAPTIAGAIGRCANQFYRPGSIVEKERTSNNRNGRADVEPI